MSDPVNLNRYKKEKARADKKARADQNAVKFGRSKAQKNLELSRVDKAGRDLTAHQLSDIAKPKHDD
jgi:hypothetical protein